MADNFKTVLKDIWDDKALLVTVLVAGGGLVYFAFFRNQGSSGNTLVNPAGTPDTSGIMVYNPFDYAASPPTTTILQVPYPVSTPTTPTPVPVTNPVGALRSLPTITSGWVASTPGGTNNKGKNLIDLAKGTVVMLLDNKAYTFGSNRYYKVSAQGRTGYINAKTLGL